MSDTLSRVLELLQIDPTGIDIKARRMPIEVPNVGRHRLAKLFGELGFTIGCEVGTEQGGYAEEICKANPTARLICVDAWQRYAGYRDHVDQGKLDRFYEATKARLAAYDVTFIRKFSVDAAKDIPDASLDFVYLDAAHDFKHVSEDLCAWVPKVKQFGIVSGHDWTKRNNPRDNVHVVETVTAYVQAYKIYPYFVLGSKPVIDGQERDRPRSFFWIKA